MVPRGGIEPPTLRFSVANWRPILRYEYKCLLQVEKIVARRQQGQRLQSFWIADMQLSVRASGEGL
jgi:hypothetical protein